MITINIEIDISNNKIIVYSSLEVEIYASASSSSSLDPKSEEFSSPKECTLYEVDLNIESKSESGSTTTNWSKYR